MVASRAADWEPDQRRGALVVLSQLDSPGQVDEACRLALARSSAVLLKLGEAHPERESDLLSGGQEAMGALKAWDDEFAIDVIGYEISAEAGHHATTRKSELRHLVGLDPATEAAYGRPLEPVQASRVEPEVETSPVAALYDSAKPAPSESVAALRSLAEAGARFCDDHGQSLGRWEALQQDRVVVDLSQAGLVVSSVDQLPKLCAGREGGELVSRLQQVALEGRSPGLSPARVWFHQLPAPRRHHLAKVLESTPQEFRPLVASREVRRLHDSASQLLARFGDQIEWADFEEALKTECDQQAQAIVAQALGQKASRPGPTFASPVPDWRGLDLDSKVRDEALQGKIFEDYYQARVQPEASLRAGSLGRWVVENVATAQEDLLFTAVQELHQTAAERGEMTSRILTMARRLVGRPKGEQLGAMVVLSQLEKPGSGTGAIFPAVARGAALALRSAAQLGPLGEQLERGALNAAADLLRGDDRTQLRAIELGTMPKQEEDPLQRRLELRRLIALDAATDAAFTMPGRAPESTEALATWPTTWVVLVLLHVLISSRLLLSLRTCHPIGRWWSDWNGLRKWSGGWTNSIA